MTKGRGALLVRFHWRLGELPILQQIMSARSQRVLVNDSQLIWGVPFQSIMSWSFHG